MTLNSQLSTLNSFDFPAIERDLEAAPAADWRFDAKAILMLCAQLQMALRYPHNSGPTADWARLFIAHARLDLPPSAQALIEAGWDAANNLPIEGIESVTRHEA